MDHLDLFALVVEQESINKASQIVNLSQPALSRKIHKLEEELGVDLFERRGKKLILTRAGELCYEFAVEMRRLQRDFMQSIGEYKSAQKKIAITIGASLTTLQSTLPDIITIYTKDAPHTEFKVLTGKTNEVVTLVKEKKVDIGLLATTISQPGIICVPLFDDPLCLVLPEGHPYKDKKSIEISDLHEMSMILFSKGTWYRVVMDEMFMRSAIFPDVTMEIDSFEAIIRLVSTCQAATLLPLSYLRPKLMEENQLVVRDIPELKAALRTTSLIYNETTALNDAAQLFIRKAKEHFTTPKSVATHTD